MNSHQFLIRMLIVSALAGLPHWVVRADDTEIYINAGANPTTDSLVMFVLDLRPNVINSTVCTGGALATCQDLHDEGYLEPDPDADDVHFADLLGAVLKKVFEALPTAGIRVGLMLNHNYKNNCEGPANSSDTSCGNGGFIAQRFVPVDESCVVPIISGCEDDNLLGFPDGWCDESEYATCRSPVPNPFLAPPLLLTGQIPTYAYNEHPYQLREDYLELFRYLTGQDVYNGHNFHIDFAPPHKNDPQFLLPWDADAENVAGTTYESPLTTGCSKVFMIHIMFGVNQQEADSDSAIEAAENAEGMGISLSGGGDTQTSQVIRYMYNRDLSELGSVPTGAGADFDADGDLAGDQNVTSYFIVKTEKVGAINNAGFPSAGGTGSAYPLDIEDPAALYELFDSIFKEILSISTTFVSASVPVNVINKANSLENVFFGIFEPESTAQWTGNIKRLKLEITDAGTLRVVDAVPNTTVEAISATDGKIKHSALTFWTNPAAWDVQAFDADKDEVAGKDGRSVYRGGAGQRIPGFLNGNDPGTPADENSAGARQVFTEPASFTNGTAATLLALDATSATAAIVWDDMKASIQGASPTDWASADAADQALAVNLLKYARGIDAFDQDADSNSTEARQWMMADALHSQPLPLNYGLTTGYTSSNQNIRIFISDNEGMMHSIRNSTTSAVADGSERWAFIPRELLGNFKTLSENAEQTDPVAGNIIKNPYGLDGKMAVYVNDTNNDNTLDAANDTVWIFFGMRRGGKSYYALDVSDPDTPKMLWSISKTSTGFEELGHTFARPRVGKLDSGNGAEPVVIFAGGYDMDKDDYEYKLADGASAGNDDEGRTVFIVKAADGTRIWTARESGPADDSGSMVDSIPSEVTVVDTDSDGLLDAFYVGDTGGRLWRGDLSGNDPSLWSIHKVFEDGRHVTGAPAKGDRRFFHRPDVVRLDASKTAVMIGSGNRAHPANISIEDRFYQVRDDGSTSFSLSSLANLTSTTTCPTSGAASGCANGWYLNLGTFPDGEKSLASPLTFLGDVYFSTYRPGGGAVAYCGPSEGIGKTYVVSVANAAAALDMNGNSTLEDIADRAEETGFGIPSDPVFITLKDGDKEGIFVLPSNLTPKEPFRRALSSKGVMRSYWYEVDR